MSLTQAQYQALEKAIRKYPDFPKPGILFQDLTEFYKQPGLRFLVLQALRTKVLEFLERRGKSTDDLVILPVTSRGYLFGSLLADRVFACPIVPVRKAEKTPPPAVYASYSLEYGTDSLAIPLEDFPTTDKACVIVDDVLATGGTASAVCQMLMKQGQHNILVLTILDIGLPWSVRESHVEYASVLPAPVEKSETESSNG